MAIRMAGRSVMSVRTKTIVQGVESEAWSFAFRSGSSGTDAADATARRGEENYHETLLAGSVVCRALRCAGRVKRVESRSALGRAGDQKTPALGFHQRERWRGARLMRSSRARSRLRAASRIPPAAQGIQPASPPGRCTAVFPVFIRSRSSHASVHSGERVMRAARLLSTTSNSVHASCTSPAASGRSSPWLHCESTMDARLERQQIAHPEIAARAPPTSSSTGSRATTGIRGQSAAAPKPVSRRAPGPVPCSGAATAWRRRLNGGGGVTG